MVATAHPLATEAAVKILKQGGNAVDAAIAAQWVLNVVEPHSSGIGGGGFFLYYEAATRKVIAVDGREKAPAGLSPELYLDAEGKAIPYIPDRITGGHSVGIPGTLKLLKTVHDRFSSGQFIFSSLFDQAIEIAEKGFLVSPHLARIIASQQDRLKLFEDSRKVFLDAEDRPLLAGTLLIQKDLAQTFRLVRDKGVGAFYEGEIADDIVSAIRQAPYRPGVIKKEDLFYYDVTVRDAVFGRYRGFDVFSMGPPSSGGVTLIEILNILKNFDVRAMEGTLAFVHIFSEAQKLAFQDRNEFLSDPDFVKMPVHELLSDDYARERSQMIALDRTLMPGQRPSTDIKTHTSHISIVDQEGNMVSYTTTIEHMFGSAMIVPGRGFFLNNELSDFDPYPLHEDGAPRANAPHPGKRPRSSMTPVLVFREGQPFLIAGSPGGSTIIGTMANLLVNMIDFQLPVEAALRESKIINRDGAVELETKWFQNQELVEALRELGHEVEKNSYFGNAQTIARDQAAGIWVGASDPRGEGLAKGY